MRTQESARAGQHVANTNAKTTKTCRTRNSHDGRWVDKYKTRVKGHDMVNNIINVCKKFQIGYGIS